MKKNHIFLLFCAAVAICAAVLFLNPKKDLPIDKLKSIQVSAPTKSSGDVTISKGSLVSMLEETNRLQTEYKKCFKKEVKLETLEAVKSALLQQKDYSAPILSEENFELTTTDQKNLVVQHIPQEENKNRVRVFAISPADGLPDRIKDFPNSGADVSLRLKGALSLGTLKSKTTSTVQNAYDGSMLSFENKDEKVIRIHLITNNFDFECKNQSCLCLTKEY